MPCKFIMKNGDSMEGLTGAPQKSRITESVLGESFLLKDLLRNPSSKKGGGVGEVMFMWNYFPERGKETNASSREVTSSDFVHCPSCLPFFLCLVVLAVKA